MTDARIYVRVSRPSEADILANQLAEANGYAMREEFRVVGRYEEVASGAGGDERRSEFARLMKDVRRGEIVIFTSLSRMTRGGVGAALEILNRLRLKGVGFHFVHTSVLNFDSRSPKLVTDIILAVLAAVDEDYRRRISEATKAALQRRKNLGLKVGGRKPGAKNRPKNRRSVWNLTDEEADRLAGASK